MLKHQVNNHEPILDISTCTRAITLLGANNINHSRYNKAIIIIIIPKPSSYLVRSTLPLLCQVLTNR
jgi:hypothetical protein